MNWRSVTQSLPPEGQTVRGAVLEGSTYREIGLVYRGAGLWWHALHYGVCHQEPTHWQPIGPPVYGATTTAGAA